MACVVAAATAACLHAQNIEQVYLKDGSEYEGFISAQVPGDHIEVSAEKAVIYLDSEKAVDLIIARKPVVDLPEAVYDWAKENRPDSELLEVASFAFGKHVYKDVVLLETGSRIKFISLTPDRYHLAWNEIYKTTKTRMGEEAISGIKDILTLKNGRYIKGYVVEQIIGSELRVRTNAGTVSSVKFSDILSINSEQIDESRSLWSQVMFLDRLELKNGEQVEGFIISRLMGRHLTIAMRDGDIYKEREIPLADISVYCKVLNDSYEENIAPASLEEQTEDDKEEIDQMEEVISRITVDDILLAPSTVEHTGLMSVLPYGVNHAVHGDMVRVRVPVKDISSALKIVPLKKKRVAAAPDKNYGGDRLWTCEDGYGSVLSACYYISSIDNDYVELTVYGLKPGAYMILPFIGDGRCAAFEIK